MSLIQACRSLALSTWLLSFCFVHLLCLDFTVAEKEEWYTAFVNITYAEPAPDPGAGAAGGGGGGGTTAELHTEKTECGRYGEHSPKQDARGEVVMASSAHDRLACDPNTKFAAPAHGKNWIALIPKGNCTYRDKIRNAFLQNASAVVIFNVGSNTNETITMSHAACLYASCTLRKISSNKSWSKRSSGASIGGSVRFRCLIYFLRSINSRKKPSSAMSLLRLAKYKIKVVMGTEQHRCSEEAEEAVSSLKRILRTPCFQRYGTNDSSSGNFNFGPGVVVRPGSECVRTGDCMDVGDWNVANVTEVEKSNGEGVEDIVAIMIPEPKGKEIVSLLERNITVTMYITIGTRNLQKYVSRTSVVFVSISFIVLMIISLAWLVFYYIQRFRYANARDRNQRRLGDAAKKAISKLQVRTIKKGDKETEPDFDNCAVCIEGYKPNDVVRILPCRVDSQKMKNVHYFIFTPYKRIELPGAIATDFIRNYYHRTCPMCKMNILKALGIPPNADCMDDLPTDFEGSLGGPSTNQITGASDTTVNESSVTLDAAVRTVGALQVVQDTDPTPQEGGIIFTTNSEQEPAISSDSDISLIMAMEVGLSDVELSTDQDCEEVKS
ncbi:hypothetical protein EI555_009349 [Monodon monoceros]|uniref:PA domain-containing protein n=1 Tax=Monodon monoceros TaxID=40151 RepID=A0A4U1FRL7_MONMO|nr:hypothetical protein EI555_009349 [Monodon monoceros]